MTTITKAAMITMTTTKNTTKTQHCQLPTKTQLKHNSSHSNELPTKTQHCCCYHCYYVSLLLLFLSFVDIVVVIIVTIVIVVVIVIAKQRQHNT